MMMVLLEAKMDPTSLIEHRRGQIFLTRRRKMASRQAEGRRSWFLLSK
jgi:uncharacterized protein with PIN domain